jgi:hypothetical protein
VRLGRLLPLLVALLSVIGLPLAPQDFIEEWVPPGWQLPLEEWHGRHLALEGPGAEALALCVLALSAYASLEAP